MHEKIPPRALIEPRSPAVIGREGPGETGSRLRRGVRSQAGFTLLELFVAFLLLALFILPLLSIVHRSRVRATHYSILNEIQELAQRKLFERIYSYSEESIAAGAMETLSGTFDLEGRPEWSWEIPYPEVKSQGEQILLEYTIRVYAPQLAAIRAAGVSAGGSSTPSDPWGDLTGTQTDTPYFEMSTWALPSISWYLEDQALREQGVDTGYYGAYGAGGSYGMPGSYGGF